jgi:hypothetical protein
MNALVASGLATGEGGTLQLQADSQLGEGCSGFFCYFCVSFFCGFIVASVFAIERKYSNCKRTRNWKEKCSSCKRNRNSGEMNALVASGLATGKRNALVASATRGR